MPSGESSVRRRTLLCAATLAASALLAPIATWSTGSALGTTSQSITFGVLLDRTLSDPALHVAASASSGLPVTFTTTTPTVCSASGTNGTTISPDAVGTCTVQANQAGDATFAPAPPVAQSFDVTKATQTISFAALPDRSLNAGAFTVTATSSSGGAVTFTTTTTTVCTASGAHGATIALVAAGTCTVQADQPGNGIFAPAPTETQSFAVGKTAQAITFGALTDKSVLQTPVTVSATATSLLPVTFTTTTPATCTAAGTNGATITLVGSGTCTVQADQAGNASFSAAPPVVRSFTVTRAPQTITFAALTARTTLQSPFAVTATSTSVLTVTFTTTTPAVCGAGGTNGSTITLVTAGTCTLQADQPGNAVFSPASSVFQSFTVTKADQTITFGALANHTVLEGPIAVSAASTSGLAVTFTTTTLAVCTSGGTNGATITLVAAGTCTVVAAQGGDATFNAATPVAEIFTVARADQAIAFAALPDVPLGTPVTVAATATSGLAVSFSTSTPAVCTASSATITLVAAGTCTVVADQTGDAVYNAAPSVARSFGVGKTDQTITFAPLPDVAVTHAPITVSATASSLLPVTFTTTTP
ncbi:MAG TPA: hypothetical protein VGP92_06375, partial [Acidimicrobiia bacterium]|nr:hypothetical protein [Acidimicrobiia bacterium]